MYFVRQGNAYVTADRVNQNYSTTLPVGTYTVDFNPMIGFYFQIEDDFEIKGKVYGTASKTVERVISTYQKRTANTGVMLSGEKGSGKTMTTKLISMVGAKLGMPTLIINSPLCGDAFNHFMQTIKQECIVIFDEFEKVYPMEAQEKLLTLFDGVFPSKKLFLITCNDRFKIAQHMMNRPGRIYYHLEYSGLEYEFIKEYTEDNLKNKQYVEGVCRLASLFSKFNFDMLKALIEEMNRYNESPVEALKYLNAKPDNESYGYHDMTLFIDGQKAEGRLYPSTFRDNPLKSDSVTVEQTITKPIIVKSKNDKGEEVEEEDEEYEEITHKFSLEDLQKIDAEGGQFIYVKGNKKLVLTRQRPKKFDITEGYDRYFTD